MLTNSMGPQARYRRYLSALVGQARVVVGTRSAAFAPVKDLQLVVILDDGNDNLVDNLKPYVHAREVLTTRSAFEGCSMVLANHSRTAETQLLVESGWAHDVVAKEQTIGARCPAIEAVGPYGLSIGRDLQGGTTKVQAQAFQAAHQSRYRARDTLPYWRAASAVHRLVAGIAMGHWGCRLRGRRQAKAAQKRRECLPVAGAAESKRGIGAQNVVPRACAPSSWGRSVPRRNWAVHFLIPGWWSRVETRCSMRWRILQD